MLAVICGVPKCVGLLRLTTTSIGDADILIGDLAQLLVAIRTQAHIEVTREAASAFEKHQVRIRVSQQVVFAAQPGMAGAEAAGQTCRTGGLSRHRGSRVHQVT